MTTVAANDTNKPVPVLPQQDRGLAHITERIEEMVKGGEGKQAFDELVAQADNLLRVGDYLQWNAWIILYLVREHELYREIRDSDGNVVYSHFESWLEEFLFHHNRSRRTAYQRLTAIHVAHKSLGMTLPEIATWNPTKLQAICLSTDHDRKTGLVAVEPRQGRLGLAEAKQIVIDCEPLTPSNTVALVKERQGVPEPVRFFIEAAFGEGHLLAIKAVDKDGLLYSLLVKRCDMPQAVIQEMASRLGADIQEI